MVVGFDKLNLDAAVAAVMKSAAEKEQDAIPQFGKKALRLDDEADVREYLTGRVADAYAAAAKKPEGIQIARIEGVLYSPVGFVFEQHAGETHPAPVRHDGEDGDSEIGHLAYFWSVL